MDSKEFAAKVRSALRKQGFTGSVRLGPGSAYCWVHITGTGPQSHEFTPRERTLLESLGFAVGGNLTLIAPENINRKFVAEKLGFAYEAR